MAQINIPLGARSPNYLNVRITPFDPSLDLTQVIGVNFTVLRQTDGVTVTWVGAIVFGATPTLMYATYGFASDGSDWPVAGPYSISPVLTMSSGGSITSTVITAECQPLSAFQYPTSPAGY